ncbi:hypothetical protein M0802_001597 [Mischocyttarus mexicanus]|nr:hypothetical protein M0802_001597 [Mischocyttarus mexicanus]
MTEQFQQIRINREFVSGLMMALASIPIVIDFKIDRPFYYSIFHRGFQGNDLNVTPLFQGHITHPKI